MPPRDVTTSTLALKSQPPCQLRSDANQADHARPVVPEFPSPTNDRWCVISRWPLPQGQGREGNSSS